MNTCSTSNGFCDRSMIHRMKYLESCLRRGTETQEEFAEYVHMLPLFDWCRGLTVHGFPFRCKNS